MSLQFEDKNLDKPDYQDDFHPLNIFLQGNVQTRSDVILSHPDVTGFIYLYDRFIRKAFYQKRLSTLKQQQQRKGIPL